MNFEIPLEPFLYELVAVVANDAHINSVHDLRGSRFCHPGHGLSSHWTDILANVSFAAPFENSELILVTFSNNFCFRLYLLVFRIDIGS